MTSPELLPCPFCGEKPHQYDGTDYYSIGCDTSECETNPSVDIHKKGSTDFRSVAAFRWNARAPSTVGMEAREKAFIGETAKETHRVAADDALMAFKWNEHSLKLSTVLALLRPYWEPLFGHGVTHQQKGTSWVMLRRADYFNPQSAEAGTLFAHRDDGSSAQTVVSSNPPSGEKS